MDHQEEKNYREEDDVEDEEDDEEEDGEEEEEEEIDEDMENLNLVIQACDHGKKNLYQILNVGKFSSKEEIQLNYDFLFKQYGMDKLTKRDLNQPEHQREKDLLISYTIIFNDKFRNIYDDLLEHNQHQHQPQHQHQHQESLDHHDSSPPSIFNKNISTKDRIIKTFLGPSFLSSLIKHPMHHVSIICQSRPYITDAFKIVSIYTKNFTSRNLLEIMVYSTFKDTIKHLAIVPISDILFGKASPFISNVLSYPLGLISNLYLMNLSIPLKTIINNLGVQDLFHGVALKYSLKIVETVIAENLDYLEMFSQMVYVNNESKYTEWFNKVMASPITKTLIITALTCPIHVALVQYQSTLLGHICARAGILTPDSAFVLARGLGIVAFVRNIYNSHGYRIFYNGFIPYSISKYFEIKKKNRENKKLFKFE